MTRLVRPSLSHRRSLLSCLAVTAMVTGWLALAAHPAIATSTADLAVTMVGDTKDLTSGNTITFAVTVTNHGPDVATGVSVDVGVSDSYVDFGGTCPDDSVASFCDLGELAPGSSVTVLYRLGVRYACSPDRLGVAVASVAHDAETVDPISANDFVRTETKFGGKPLS